MVVQKLGLRERKKIEAQQAIRAAAFRLFLKHGYGAVNVEQIASAANVSRSTFFNYFPNKEAVVLEPEPGQLDLWQELWSRRPDGEPLWQSLTAVLLGSLDRGREWITALHQLQQASAESPRSASIPLARELRAWIDDRTDPQQRAEAHLQLNVALAAISSAFEEWPPTTPFDTLLGIARRHLDRLAVAF